MTKVPSVFTEQYGDGNRAGDFGQQCGSDTEDAKPLAAAS